MKESAIIKVNWVKYYSIAITILVILISKTFSFAQDNKPESLLGSLAPIVSAIHEMRGFPMDYAHRGKLSHAQWQNRGRAEVQRALAYDPQKVPLNIIVHSVEKRPGYDVRTISFAGSSYYRIPAFLLVPEGKGPFPAIVALHDHSGWFLHGKEKLVSMKGEHVALQQLRNRSYGGRAYAEELVKRGFVVIVADAFYWGELRLQYKHPPKEFLDRISGLDTATIDYVRTMNRLLEQRIPDLHMRLSFAGTSWGGIVNFDDRRAVDVLSSLPEVDAENIGCIGLSGGGFRSTYLAGLEPRIKAAVIVGWMTSLPTTIDMPYSVHTVMFDAFGSHTNLDHPDIASLAAPGCAIFVQNCAKDKHFTRSGMEVAVEKIRVVYEESGHPDKFQSRFYDVPHQFSVEMQEDAFAWMERWLCHSKP